MNKKYYAAALLICLVLLVSACKQSGAATGGAPRTPFIGGTAGITINFEKDSPPPEVTDDTSFSFRTIMRLKNDGETKVDKNNMRINLVGFDPQDFGASNDDIREQRPEDDLDSRKRDAEGNIIEGTTTFASFPIGGSNDFTIPRKFSGNTEFTFRANVCYAYETRVTTKLCILRDMINIRDNSLCKPTQGRTMYSSSAPVQASNLRETVIGKDKVAFSFDISLNGNVDIFRDNSDTTPASGFDAACPSDPRQRRQVENKVKVVITTTGDPVVNAIKCGGLDSGDTGTITLVNGKRTLTCTADLSTDRVDLEKTVDITLSYNVLDDKETKVLVKHLAETSS